MNRSTHKPGGLFKQMAVLGAPHATPRKIVSLQDCAQFWQAIEHLSRADRVLARLIKTVGPCRLKPELRVSPFAALVEAVAYQQLNGKAAASILARVKALFPGHKFPAPEDFLHMPDARLRAAGLSRAKLAAIKDLSEKALAGVVPSSRAITRMSDGDIVECLTAIRGVGRWTVEMLLIFKLGRPDVLPATDYGVRQGFARTYGWPELPTPAELEAHGERWRPYRTIQKMEMMMDGKTWTPFWEGKFTKTKPSSVAAGAERASTREEPKPSTEPIRFKPTPEQYYYLAGHGGPSCPPKSSGRAPFPALGQVLKICPRTSFSLYTSGLNGCSAVVSRS